MGLDWYAESSAIWKLFKTILQKWEKHCITLHSLADQIMGLERCEKDSINVPQETFLAVQITIESKIMEELQNLVGNIHEMEVQHIAMTSLLGKVTARCQYLLERHNKDTPEFQQLQTIDSVNNHMAVMIAMKKVPLQKAKFDDLQSLQEFKQINILTKCIENELEKCFF